MPQRGKSKVHSESGENKIETLDRAIDSSGILDIVMDKCNIIGKKPSNCVVAIKPNIMMFHSRSDPSAHTDPEVVEHVISRLRKMGFSGENIKVVESQNITTMLHPHRTVREVAREVGYTEGGYEVRDLTKEPVPHDYGPDSILGVDLAGKSWKEADVRINIPKVKTHQLSGFTSCVKNIGMGTLPDKNKIFRYHYINSRFKDDWGEVTADNVIAIPDDICIADAWITSDGPQGQLLDTTPENTKTFVVGDNSLAVDLFIAKEKMGFDDPVKANAQLQAMKRKLGDLPDYEASGDREKWEGFNIPPGFKSRKKVTPESLIVLAIEFIDTFGGIPSGLERLWGRKAGTKHEKDEKD